MADVPSELLPYLVGEYDQESGEWAMRCPHPDHEDNKRSASINVPDEVWYCFGCGEGGPLGQLAHRLREGDWAARAAAASGQKVESGKKDPLKKSQVRQWHKWIMSKKFRDERRYLTDQRGIDKTTIKDYGIGYDPLGGAWTIPIYDVDGKLINCRKYDPNPPPQFPKMRSIKGRGAPTLFPIEMAESSNPVLICEGEWDALRTIQELREMDPIDVVTRTGAADVWKKEWNELFRDRKVYLCHDKDEKGLRANEVVRAELSTVTDDITTVDLPYEYNENHGKDLSDYWDDGHTAEEFMAMLEGSTREAKPTMTVLESMDGKNFGKVGLLRVRVAGVVADTFLVPDQVKAICKQDLGDECETCPMNNLGGQHEFQIPPNDKSVLKVLYGTAKEVRKAMLSHTPVAFDCQSLGFDVRTQHTVAKVFATQSMDSGVTFSTNAKEMSANRLIHVVGRHDTQSNEVMEVTGEIRPNPQTQRSEFVGWGARPVERDIDRYELSDQEADDIFDMFGADDASSTKRRLKQVADDLAEHVTKIYGRTNMHILMDLVLHSVLKFSLGDQDQSKGWLDAIIVGETRTGKSEAASRLLAEYGRGTMVSLEAATLAGVLGGVQQLGGKEWVATWGVIPMNDRGAVVLDEVSGLSGEEIGSMSSMRSSGIAEMTKIKDEKTLARTRLLWIGNPRNSSAHFSSGIHMLSDLIQKPEDVARFDLAMSVHGDDPGTERANQYTTEIPDRYTDPVLMRKLLVWSWSRSPENVVFTNEAVEAVYEHAVEMGSYYTERPPLVQKANVRVKIARVAAAVAARTFSSEDGVKLLVLPHHVRVANDFMRAIYDADGFGYGKESDYYRERIALASKHWDDAMELLVQNTELARYLRGATNEFSALELRNMGAYDSFTDAVAEASKLYQWGFLDKHGEHYVMNRQIRKLLEGVPH